MRNRVEKCTVKYDVWSMQCCGAPLRVGRVADLFCVKTERYKNCVGLEIDYEENYHGNNSNCCLRGMVTRIQVIFVDKYAKIDGLTKYIDDPNNDFAIIDVDYINGWENCESYGHRKGENACEYVITLENVIERESEEVRDNCCIYIQIGEEGKE